MPRATHIWFVQLRIAVLELRVAALERSAGLGFEALDEAAFDDAAMPDVPAAVKRGRDEEDDA